MFKIKKLAVVLGACGVLASSVAWADVKVGALFPFSGALALLGQESYRGLELAVNEINAAGGLNGEKIQIIKADAVDPTQAVSETKRLTSSNVAAVFGSYASGISYAATPVTELAGVPYFELGATAHKITTRNYKYLFRSNPNTALYGVSVVNALHEMIAPGMGLSPKDIKIGIIHEDGPYGTDVAATEKQRAAELGYTVAEVLPYSAKTVDLSSLILRLKGAGVNVVLQTAYQNDAILYFNQAKSAGFTPKVVIGAGGGYSLADTAKAVGPGMNGVFDLDFPQSSINPAGAPGLDKFLEAYKSTYKSDPQSGHSLTNYVGAKAFFEAMAQAKSTDADKIRAAVLAYKKPGGQTANGWGFDFGEDGQNKASTFYVMQWQDNKLVTIAPKDLALGKPVFNK
ncbi:ABC transporter substrate-binding protein [Alcaligenaceae bacterium A4P071]|uniref:ABC transporter substrate-binding protein n=1 Tax=Schauerella aestuarii TaxID=2511204 RepID=UPI0013718F77|nr:ABC transporter substrate-binding protein [Achromobacter aestuarii]MDQ2138805.1 ABC transporter substrate-binding protein [Alcaligenaceae bacterium B3P038]MDQ2149589.1 ABC transporter substrate-binding protein [Alcaligenaceae bacterium C4P045]MDQ2183922.1 ABC transporter substrate-binding protein [Alcaligenaceae bacterium A4P071]MYZ44661.1 amino acid-binding protein [Achromobacter aestuarii]